jgi:hypothetical protein
VRRERDSETWSRRFDEHRVVTNQKLVQPRIVRERFRWIEFDLQVKPADGGIRCESISSRMRFGPVAIPLPLRYQPEINAAELPRGEGTHIDVRVLFPANKELLSYRGSFVWRHF